MALAPGLSILEPSATATIEKLKWKIKEFTVPVLFKFRFWFFFSLLTSAQLRLQSSFWDPLFCVQDQPKTFFQAISFYDEPEDESLLNFSLFDSGGGEGDFPALPPGILDRWETIRLLRSWNLDILAGAGLKVRLQLRWKRTNLFPIFLLSFIISNIDLSQIKKQILEKQLIFVVRRVGYCKKIKINICKPTLLLYWAGVRAGKKTVRLRNTRQ